MVNGKSLLLFLVLLLSLRGLAQQVDRIDQYIAIGRLDAALELATTEIRAYPGDVRLYKQRAHIYSLTGQPGLAIVDIDQAIKRTSSNKTLAELYQLRGEIHENAGMWIDAYSDYSIAVETDPSSASAHAHIGDICCEMGYYPLAIEAYRKAESLAPHNPNYRIERARALLAAGQHEEAAQILRAILADNPEQEEAKRLLAAYHYAEGRYDLYTDMFLEYISTFFVTHHFPPASYKTLLHMEDENGYAYLTQALNYEIDHQEGDLAVLLRQIKAELEMNHQDYELAISDLTNLIETEQDYDHSALFDRGDCYYRMGRYDEAIADYTDLITKWSYDHVAYLYRAQAKEKAGQYDSAIADYCTYAHLEHTEAARMYRLCAAIEHTNGHPARAAYYLTRSIEVETDPEWLNTMIQERETYLSALHPTPIPI